MSQPNLAGGGDCQSRQDEKRIAQAAESRLRRTSYEALRCISCEVQDGAIVLRGVLPSFYLKQVAQIVVANLEGAQRIINEIEVPPAAPSANPRPR